MFLPHLIDPEEVNEFVYEVQSQTSTIQLMQLTMHVTDSNQEAQSNTEFARRAIILLCSSIPLRMQMHNERVSTLQTP